MLSRCGTHEQVARPDKAIRAVELGERLSSLLPGRFATGAARELMRAHDACRRDLMTAHHAVSKMLLRHGRVYPKSSTWTVKHRG